MEVVEPASLKNVPEHSPESQTHSRQMPKELIELRDYLEQLNNYMEKYNRIKENIAEKIRENETQMELPSCEMSCSVKEDVSDELKSVEIVVMPPTEPITVISETEKNVSDVDSIDSEVGIYFVEDVNLVRFINVMQRELSALTELFPSVERIVLEMKKEFDHFKDCSGCLKNVSPLLPDILKELQELIKFIKKNRNESYSWPNDSDYLRKSTEELSKSLMNEVKDIEKNLRKETVGFVTVHTNTGNLPLRKFDSFNPGEHISNARSECVRWHSLRFINCPKLSGLRSETERDLRLFEKVETVEKLTEFATDRNGGGRSFLTEFSTAQVLRILDPIPVIEKAIQLRPSGRITSSDDETQLVSVDESENDVAIQAKRFISTAKIALEEACSVLKCSSQRGDAETELKTDVKDLKDLMLEAHQNQIRLSKVLLENNVLSAAVVQLTDPKILYEEKRGIERATNSLTNGGSDLDNRKIEELQCLVEDLKLRCNAKNHMIMSLLNAMRGNVPKQHWENMICCVLREAETENLEDFFRKSFPPTPENHRSLKRREERKKCGKKDFGIDEIVSETEVKRTWGRCKKSGRSSARSSLSEVLSKISNCFHETDYKLGDRAPSLTPLRRVCGMRELNSERERVLTELESERTDAELLKTESGSATINVTIRIGDEKTMDQYRSVVSIIQSGTMLTEKKSEMSLLERMPKINFVAGESTATIRREASFKGLALKFNVPLTFQQDGDGGGKARIENGKLHPDEFSISGESCLTFDPVEEALVKKSSWESAIGNNMAKSQLFTSTLYPPIDIYCEQNVMLQALRSRLRFIEESLRCLEKKIDSMDVISDKLKDDAYERLKNFKEISKRYSILSNC